MPLSKARDAHELADIMMAMHRTFFISLSAQLSGGNISVPQFSLLGFLEHGEGLSMSQLAARMHHSTAATTGLVDRLVDAGYVERFEDPSDRRKVMVKITSEGAQVVGRVKDDMVNNLLRIFDQIGRDDRAAWLRIYRQIAEMLHAQAPQEAPETAT